MRARRFLCGCLTVPLVATRAKGASGTTAGKGEVPSLAKEGWPRHQVNGPVPLGARPGWFVQLPIIGGLNQPPRLRPLKEASRHFLNGRSHPSLSKGGDFGFPFSCFQCSGRRWPERPDEVKYVTVFIRGVLTSICRARKSRR